METLTIPQFLGYVLVCIVLLLFIIPTFGVSLGNIVIFLFVPETKIVRGKIMEMDPRSTPIPAILPSGSFYGDTNYPIQETADRVFIEYWVFVQDRDDGHKHEIEVDTQNQFKEIMEKRELEPDQEFSFYLKKHFLFGEYFHHFETA